MGPAWPLYSTYKMLNFKHSLWSDAAARQDDVLEPDVWRTSPSGTVIMHPCQIGKGDAMLWASDAVCSSPPGEGHTTELVCQLESSMVLPWPTDWKCSTALGCVALLWHGASPSWGISITVISWLRREVASEHPCPCCRKQAVALVLPLWHWE